MGMGEARHVADQPAQDQRRLKRAEADVLCVDILR
jgi:hypothetical protein